MNKYTLEELKELSNDYQTQEALRQLHNEAMNFFNYNDDEIFTMYDFEEVVINEMKTTEAINKVFYGDFNPNHDWAMFNGYGNFKSTMFIDDFIDYDLILEYQEEANNE